MTRGEQQRGGVGRFIGGIIPERKHEIGSAEKSLGTFYDECLRGGLRGCNKGGSEEGAMAVHQRTKSSWMGK